MLYSTLQQRGSAHGGQPEAGARESISGKLDGRERSGGAAVAEEGRLTIREDLMGGASAELEAVAVLAHARRAIFNDGPVRRVDLATPLSPCWARGGTRTAVPPAATVQGRVIQRTIGIVKTCTRFRSSVIGDMGRQNATNP